MRDIAGGQRRASCSDTKGSQDGMVLDEHGQEDICSTSTSSISPLWVEAFAKSVSSRPQYLDLHAGAACSKAKRLPGEPWESKFGPRSGICVLC